MDIWKALAAEFIGTFTITLIIAGAVAASIGGQNYVVAVSLASAFVLSAVIYTWAQQSRAHVNPAISFGAAVAGEMPWLTMVAYWIVQLLGSLAAAALVSYIFGTANGAGASVGSLTNTDMLKAFVVEAFLTFFLVMGFLMTMVSEMGAFTTAITLGLILGAAFVFGGLLTGASLNPARSFGPAIFGGQFKSYWIYFFAPLVGALVAGLIYRAFNVNWYNCGCVEDNQSDVMIEKVLL